MRHDVRQRNIGERARSLFGFTAIILTSLACLQVLTTFQEKEPYETS